MVEAFLLQTPKLFLFFLPQFFLINKIFALTPFKLKNPSRFIYRDGFCFFILFYFLSSLLLIVFVR